MNRSDNLAARLDTRPEVIFSLRRVQCWRIAIKFSNAWAVAEWGRCTKQPIVTWRIGWSP